MTIDNQLFFATVEESLATGKPVKITLRGTSMNTFLREGDVLTLEPVGSHPRVGDVVLFRHHGQHLLHRVVKIHGGRYTMQGDNCIGEEHAVLEDIVAVLTAVERLGEATGSQWAAASRQSLRRKRVKQFFVRWFSERGRRQLQPWYFFALAILMWAPLNGMGIPLNNFVFGIRGDHLLHATVFIPCTLYMMDLTRYRWLVWMMGVGLALLCESIQFLLPYRSFDVNDMIANVLGVTLGWVVVLVVQRRLSRSVA